MRAPASTHDGLVTALAELANLDAQRRAWVERDPSAFTPDPGELVVQVLGGLARSSAVSPVAHRSLALLGELVDDVDTNLDPKLLLRDPHWRKLAEQAATSLVLVRAALAA